MATTVTVVDDWAAGGAKNEWALELLTERVTARELIRGQVYQEVQEYNAQTPGYFRGLVQPTEAERVISGSIHRATDSIMTPEVVTSPWLENGA